MLDDAFARFWLEHAEHAGSALVQASSSRKRRRVISYRDLCEWIQTLRQLICPSPSSSNEAHEWLVVAINVAPFSIEETALLLLVAGTSNVVYVPVDIQLPLPRQLALLRTARAQYLVTLPGSPLDKFFASKGQASGDTTAIVDAVKAPSSPFRSVQVMALPNGESLCELTRQRGKKLGGDDGNAPLYLLFTSGSTGNPRGVLGSRTGAWNRLEWMWEAYPFGKPKPDQRTGERVLRSTKLSFVDSVWEVLGAFLQCVPLVHLQKPRDLPTDNGKYLQSVLLDDSEQFQNVLRSEHVTRFTAVPSVLEVLLLQTRRVDRQNAFRSLRYILSSGEILRSYVVQQLTAEFPELTILNLYGSTEVSGDVMCMRFKAPLSPEQLVVWGQHGLPIAELNQQGIIGKDTHLMLLPDDVEKDKLQHREVTLVCSAKGAKNARISAKFGGRVDNGLLYVSGPLLALGYVDGDDKVVTFTELCAHDNEGWFCMGDVCLAVGGFLYYCGRKDHVIKIHGQRVNLEVVERIVLAGLSEIENSPQTKSEVTGHDRCGELVLALAFTEKVGTHAMQRHFIAAGIIRDNQDGLSVPYSQTQALTKWITERYGAAHAPSELLIVPATAVSRSAHGKVDRRSLRQLFEQHMNRVRSFIGENDPKQGLLNDSNPPTRKVLGCLLADIIGIPLSDASPLCTFGELGGNSLLATLFVHEVRQTFGSSSLTAHDLINMTVSDMVSALDSPPEYHPKASVKLSTGPTSFDSTHGTEFPGPCDAVKRRRTSQSGNLNFLSRYNQSSMTSKDNYVLKWSPSQWKLRSAWRVDLGKCIDASPLVIERRDDRGAVDSVWAIIGSHSAQLVCVDVLKTGREIWRVTLDDRIEACASLGLKDELVFVGTYAGTLFALTLQTGHIQWQFHAKASIKATAVVIDERRLVVCGAYDSKVYGLDTRTGDTRWEIDIQGSLFSTPHYCKWSKQIFAGSTAGTVVALELISSGNSDLHGVKIQWQLNLLAPVFGGLNVDFQSKILLVGCADGQLYGVDMTNGSIRWKLSTEKPIFSSPCVYGAGCVVFGSHDGMLRKACCRNGELVWTTNLGSAVFASPTVVAMVPGPEGSPEGRLVCCVTTTAGQICFCDEGTGTIISQTHKVDTGNGESAELGPLFGSPVIYSNWCLLGTRMNYLYAFALDG